MPFLPKGVTVNILEVNKIKLTREEGNVVETLVCFNKIEK